MRPPASILGLAAIALIVSGCAAGQGPSAAPPSASPVPSPSATPKPSPSPSAVGPGPTVPAPPPEAEIPVDLGSGSHDVTCGSLLDESTTAAFDAAAPDGWLFSEDFEQRMIEQDHFLATFVEYGGTACQWGYLDTDNVYQYAWSPITETEARQIELEFAERGFEQSTEHGGRLHCAPPDDLLLGYDDCYLFMPDGWFYTSDRSQLAMFVAQAGN